MKRFVRLPVRWQAVFFGFGSLLLVGIVQAETLASYLLVAGLAALVARGEWIRRRREKDEATRQA
jgi:hypothetical protein